MEQLADRTAVVVGAGGIGRGIALGLAAEGMSVVVADIEPASAEAVVTEIRSAGGRGLATRVDATDRRSLQELAEQAVSGFGAIHVLANTVGVILDRRLDEASEAEWAWFLEFNIMAIVRAVDVMLPYLRAHGEPAHIVNTSSLAGLLALPPEAVGGYFNGLYTTTKHALIGYCEMLRSELADHGIGVSVLCPGLVAGNLSSTSARNRPERFGGPMPDPRAGQGPPPSALPNERVGPFVVAGIKANRFAIFTHPDAGVRSLIEQRQRALLDDLSFYAGIG